MRRGRFAGRFGDYAERLSARAAVTLMNSKEETDAA